MLVAVSAVAMVQLSNAVQSNKMLALSFIRIDVVLVSLMVGLLRISPYFYFAEQGYHFKQFEHVLRGEAYAAV